MAQCHTCQRSFATKQARNQHARDSHSLVIQASCNVCNVSFDSKESLDQHTRDSPRHRSIYSCGDCDRSFTTAEARDQHIRDAPSHATRFDCKQCNRSYSTKDALDQHVRDSPSHGLAGLPKESLASPADKGSLDDGVTLDIMDSITAGLANITLNGTTDSKSQTKKKSRTAKTVQSEILARYGTSNKLEGIQQVCADVGIVDIPQSVSACQKVSPKAINRFCKQGTQSWDRHCLAYTSTYLTCWTPEGLAAA